MIYEIFNKNVKINIKNEVLKGLVVEELSVYKQGGKQKIDFIINFVDKIELNCIYSNTPSIHKTFSNGFICDFNGHKIKFEYLKQLVIDIEYNTKESFLSKFRNIGYRNNMEQVGHVLHELILVPMNFFNKENAIIHSSSMKSLDKNKTIMIGGTGGVGKTSLELLLCRELNYSFISDDIAVVNNEKTIYPNLAFPKIYAYNVVGNIELENILFKDKPFKDNLQWNLMKKMRGNSKVRRSISPELLFKNIEKSSNTIDEYYILFKSNNVTEITIKSIDPEMATKLTIDILKNEYHSVFQHIIWHEYNCNLMKFQPIIKLEKVFENWMKIYIQIFSSINCNVVEIPINIEHNEFLNEMKKIFE